MVNKEDQVNNENICIIQTEYEIYQRHRVDIRNLYMLEQLTYLGL